MSFAKNPISAVEEYCAKFYFKATYEEGVDDASNQFENILTVRSIDGHAFTSRGRGLSKKAAKTQAAELMLPQLLQPIPLVPTAAPVPVPMPAVPMAEVQAPATENSVAGPSSGIPSGLSTSTATAASAQSPLTPLRQETVPQNVTTSSAMTTPVRMPLFQSKAQVALANIEWKLRNLAAEDFQPGTNYTGILNEFCQKKGMEKLPVYTELKRIGLSHKLTFHMSCSLEVPNQATYEVEGAYPGTLKSVKQALAYEMLKKVVAEVLEPEVVTSAPTQDTPLESQENGTACASGSSPALKQVVQSEAANMGASGTSPNDGLIAAIVAQVIAKMSGLQVEELNEGRDKPGVAKANVSEGASEISGFARPTVSIDEGFVSSGSGSSGSPSPDEPEPKAVAIALDCATGPVQQDESSFNLPNLDKIVETKDVIETVKAFLKRTEFPVAGSWKYLELLCRSMTEHAVPGERVLRVVFENGKYRCYLTLDIRNWVRFELTEVGTSELNAMDMVANKALDLLSKD